MWRAVGVWLVSSLALGGWLAGCAGRPAVDARPRFTYSSQQVDADLQADLEALQGHVTTYIARYGELPGRLPELRDTPDAVAIIETLPVDPWGVPYVMRKMGSELVIYSTGADLIAGSSDDAVLRLDFNGVDLLQWATSAAP